MLDREASTQRPPCRKDQAKEVATGQEDRMNTKELIDRIFKEPGVKFELTEFQNLGKPIHDIISVYGPRLPVRHRTISDTAARARQRASRT